MNAIGPMQPSGIPPLTAGLQAKPAGGAQGFKDILLQSVREANALQQEADAAVERMAAGEEVTAAEVLTAVQKADIAFKLMMQIRNKLVQAYQELQAVRV